MTNLILFIKDFISVKQTIIYHMCLVLLISRLPATLIFYNFIDKS